MTDEVSLAKAKQFYMKGKEPAERVIWQFLKDHKLILHGQTAINYQLPQWLRKVTQDYDIFSPNSEETAKRLEKALNEKYKGDYFAVEPAIHLGTQRVRSKITKMVIADITMTPDKGVEIKRVNGVNLASLEYFKKHIKETLKDKNNEFRHAKDKEVLQRIKVFEMSKGDNSSIVKELNNLGYPAKDKDTYIYISDPVGLINFMHENEIEEVIRSSGATKIRWTHNNNGHNIYFERK